MKVFISADIEGTAGIAHDLEGLHSDPAYQQIRTLMTREVLAACEGAIAAGASEILIKDAHHTGRNLLLEDLPEMASVIRGWSGDPMCMMQGLDDSFDAAICIGYHAKAGDESNPLAHTLRGSVSRMWINDVPMSEFSLNAMSAERLGVPVVFLSGDAGICADVAAFNPAIGTAAVTVGQGPSARSVSPARARQMIRAGVERALAGDLQRCRVPLPDRFELRIAFARPYDAFRARWFPGMSHDGDRTVSFRSTDIFEVLTAIEFVVLRG